MLCLILQEDNIRNIVNGPFESYTGFSVTISVLSEPVSLSVSIHS